MFVMFKFKEKNIGKNVTGYKNELNVAEICSTAKIRTVPEHTSKIILLYRQETAALSDLLKQSVKLWNQDVKMKFGQR
ncbi:ABC-type uncharacterized transport system substrate-binding protein [Methanomicrobium sp. W14]|nr:ABC-type uncharacterized transport system substrate-binding protein [Methanomicrobium sp. W14]